MSTHRRLAKGAVLSIARVAVALFGQVVTVPIFLAHWGSATYGVWLILQGLLGYLSLFSVAYQQFIYGEVLKCGPGDPGEVRRIYWAALAVGYLIAAVEFVGVLSIAPSSLDALLPAASGVQTQRMVQLLVSFSCMNLVMMPFGAITSQVMTIHGYFPLSALWGLFHAVVILFVPLVAVVSGADLVAAGFAQLWAHVLSALLMAINFASIAKRYKLFYRPPIDWGFGAVAGLMCLPLAGRSFIDSFRQQGFRILLGTFAGATAVTALATTRTFANVLQQGLNSLTAPLMPELMRFVVLSDQDRTEGAFAAVWLCLFTFLVPGVLLLCLVAKPVLIYWTRGEVNFDPILFLTLLVVVLTFAAGQPAAAFLQGQNKIVWMIGAAVAGAVGLVLFSLLLIPVFGLRGGGFALLSGEICATAVTVAGTAYAMQFQKLTFPWRSYRIVTGNVCTVYILSLLCLTLLPDVAWSLVIPLIANTFLASLYFLSIPPGTREHIRVLILATMHRLTAFLAR